MKVVKFGLFFASILMAQFAMSQSEGEKEAEKLFAAMGMEDAIVQSMDQMIDLQLQQNPTLAPYKSVMMRFFNKHMSWESLKPEFVRIYTAEFSASELREMNAFYATETGKKTIRLMPSLMAQGGQIGAARVQANITELQSMIRAESERLQRQSEE